MFKGSLLPKGGHLTRRFAEDMPVLRGRRVPLKPIKLSNDDQFLTFGVFFLQTKTLNPKFGQCYAIKAPILYSVALAKFWI